MSLRLALSTLGRRSEAAIFSIVARGFSGAGASNSSGGIAAGFSSSSSRAASSSAASTSASSTASSTAAAAASVARSPTPLPPWTPTRELVKRKFLPRRMAHLLQVLEAEAEAASTAARAGSAALNSSSSSSGSSQSSSSSASASPSSTSSPLPQIRPGDVVEARLAVPENRGRVATVRGVCIALRRRGWRSSVALLNHVPGGGRIERLLPLHSPLLRDVKVVEAATTTRRAAGGGSNSSGSSKSSSNNKGPRRVRRAKLYYLRDRNPKEYKS